LAVLEEKMKRILGVLAGLLLVAGSASAETTICTVISVLPYTITAQGSYCLDRNLSTSITTGAAITINTSYVVLDLNGFKVGGGGGGFGTQASGVLAANRQNVTVKNGNIRGFYRAVYLTDAGLSQGHLVEDIRADENTRDGIWVEGKGNVVRNNQVVKTTGSTVGGLTEIGGIVVVGPGSRLLNNDVTDTIEMGAAEGVAMLVRNGDGAIVEGNRIGNAVLAATSLGVSVETSDDVLVVGNRLATLGSGVVYGGGSNGKYRDNLTSGVTTPFTGGTDAGNNN
jgi:hypothetical protein